jgi:hypothetical protein
MRNFRSKTNDPIYNDPRWAPPPASQLVDYLNDNARRVQAVRSTEVDINAKKGLMGFGLTGLLVCQKPLNFRLKGNAMSKPVVDLGSNLDEFWFWTSEEKPAYVYHCAHQELGQAKEQLAIPFKPEMFVAALGLAEYDTGKAYEVKAKNDTLELIEPASDPSGRRIFKVTVFNRSITRAPTPQVIAHVLRDASGKDICSATIKEVVIDPAPPDPSRPAVLPRVVQLSWPAQKLELTMKMRDIQSVQIDPARAGRMFSRQDLAGNPSYDLGRGRPDAPGGYSQGTSIQRTSAPGPGRSW